MLLHALHRGWTSTDIATAVESGHWAGLAGLYRTKYGRRLRRQSPQRRHRPRPRPRYSEAPLHKPHTSAPHPRGAGRIGAAASRRLRRWLAALHQAVADGRWGRKSFGVELVVWAVADAARHSQSIYADFGVRHLSMGTGTVLDPSSTAAILRTLRAEDDHSCYWSNQAPVWTRTGTNCGSRTSMSTTFPTTPTSRLCPTVSHHLANQRAPARFAFAVFSSLATFRVFRLLDRATAASAPALAATAHVSIRTVRSVMKELRGHGLGPTNPAGLAPGSTKSRRRRIT